MTISVKFFPTCENLLSHLIRVPTILRCERLKNVPIELEGSLKLGKLLASSHLLFAPSKAL